VKTGDDEWNPNLNICGNNVIGEGEECDGTELGNFDCFSMNAIFNEGTLACYPAGHALECTFNTSYCLSESCNDNDGDNSGDPASAECSISQFDCDDGNANIYPTNPNSFCDCDGDYPQGTAEICFNDIDEDCDGVPDDDCPTCDDYDNDGDDSPGVATDPPDLCPIQEVDCDDENALIYPTNSNTYCNCVNPYPQGTAEDCSDGEDNDCDGLTDAADPECSTSSELGPQPGDIYKEYIRAIYAGNDWRVTDPDAPYQGTPGNEPEDFLPNPVLDINIDDLENAIKAEVTIDLWGGHAGTSLKRMKFNSNDWIHITPHISGTPTEPECYMQEYNPTFEVPLSDLIQGENTFQGTSGGQICHNFGWGQWGWYAIIVRIYYSSKTHATGSITSPVSGGSFTDSPTVTVSGSSIDEVHVVGYYEDLDFDGDGIFHEYQESYFKPWSSSSAPPVIDHHVGSRSGSGNILWDTTWIPDQVAGSIQLVARIKNSDDVWFVTQPVAGLTLSRSGYTVQMYKPEEVPEAFSVRAGAHKSSYFTIPVDHNLGNAISAKLHARTWNGIGQEPEINGEPLTVGGLNHRFDQRVVELPLEFLQNGQNQVEWHDTTHHHGVEVLWPGPTVLVRYEN